MNERIDFVCVNKDCDFCKSAEKVRSVYRKNIPPSCFECDAPLQEATPASTSGEDIPDASDKLKMCCKSAVVRPCLGDFCFQQHRLGEEYAVRFQLTENLHTDSVWSLLLSYILHMFMYDIFFF